MPAKALKTFLKLLAKNITFNKSKTITIFLETLQLLKIQEVAIN